MDECDRQSKGFGSKAFECRKTCDGFLQYKNSEMGCGVVQLQASASKHSKQSLSTLQDLLPKLTPDPPFLSEHSFTQFSASLRQNQSVYILKVGACVPPSECPPAPVLDKWRIVLYGLWKDDCAYRRCLGFELRHEKQLLTTRQYPRQPYGSDPSYQQLKKATQYHECFNQIEKDLNRTFSFEQETKAQFERVLKRIANHFPSMGYTQGVNFVVGYLLLLGYQETDTFWLFAHLAMNRNYLLLGLYEDGFPLASIYTLVFKNQLQRVDPQLHHHIYANLMLDDSIWIFKWFITYYIYSFPLPSVQYVWDLVVETGGLGLVYFAVALVTQLKPHFMLIQDPCDASEFLQGLKDLKTFNQYLKIDEVVQQAYEMRLTKEDLAGIEQLKPSFYQQYFRLLLAELYPEGEKPSKLKPLRMSSHSPHLKQRQADKSKQTHKLHLWYVKLLEERIEFTKKSEEEREVVREGEVAEMLREEYGEMQKSVRVLEEKVRENLSQRSIRELPEGYFNQLLDGEAPKGYLVQAQLPQHPELSQLVDSNNGNPRLMTRLQYDIGEQIDELEELDNDSDSHHNEPSEIMDSKEPSIRLEVHEFRANRHNGNVSPKDGDGLGLHRKKTSEAGSKANNMNIGAGVIRSGFGLAGHNILSNLSVANSHSSIDSKQTKPKKQKENQLSRYHLKPKDSPDLNSNSHSSNSQNNSLSKVEALSQLSHLSNDLSSEHESSIDLRTEKDSLSGLTHRDHLKNQRPSYGKNKRRTQQELMAISHGPEKNSSANGGQKVSASEIELFNGEGLFKKKKRTYNHNSIVTSLTQEMSINAGDSSKELRVPELNLRTLNDEQSLESVLQLSTARKPTRQPRQQTTAVLTMPSSKSRV